ncbi:MAG: efflux RND transporter periplasmic adaptor subunit [Gemmatimonadales bacterium]
MTTPRFLLLGLTLAACATPPAPPAPAARPVRTAAVIDTVAARPIVAVGTLGARNESDLAFTGAGVVARIAVRAGERVRAGQTLATLDPQQVDASLTGARASVEKAERDAARARRLHADSVIGLATMQDAETALTAARAQLESASFARRTAAITAPVDGIVLVVLREAGSVVAPGTAILRFAGTTTGSVFRAGLTDRDALAVAVGDAAEVTLDAIPDRILRGRVTERAAAPTPGTGTYAVEIAVDGVADLPRGLAGSVTIARRVGDTVRVVPIAAIVEANRERGVVFVLNGTTAERRDVTIAFLSGSRVAITGRLDGVSRVVTEGAAYLSHGETVREVAP